ncbi:unnamed protein product [Nezara viridula]|uniref:Neuropeptide n=1 Tax=Nezara viridula TaxID=85310 RepID=A0A9P0HQ84_NEZVI|nr:unnamed protein product [Nezara viridula]
MSKLVLFLLIGVCVIAVHMAPTDDDDAASEIFLDSLEQELKQKLSEIEPRIQIDWKKLLEKVKSNGMIYPRPGPYHGMRSIASPADSDVEPRINWKKLWYKSRPIGGLLNPPMPIVIGNNPVAPPPRPVQ